MFSRPFFIGSGSFTYWYLFFYVASLPLYLLGLVLLVSLPTNTSPDAREVALNVLSFGYLLLGIFSLIHTLLYARKTKKYLRGLSILFGSQILFWIIGGFLGNNYGLLSVYFSLFLVYTIYMNLVCLSYIHQLKKEKKKKH